MENKLNLLRIFVALPISDKFSEFILKIQKEFMNFPARWIKKENLHITLVPPWYENNIDSIKQKLQKLENQIASFKIKFNLIESGPNKNFPRLIWMIGETSQEILNLRLKLYTVLNFKMEQKEFKIHLTIARFKETNKNLNKIYKNIFWEENFSQFILMKSNLLKSGAEYEILQKINLK
ncbi:MAG: RNA 2',3'-cyclic phosphodiesterase [bacterium]|nr:RNA 2',3'-cyclic phosphodiesterase [bacterium]